MKPNFLSIQFTLLLLILSLPGFAIKDTTNTYYDQYWFKCGKKDAVFFGKKTETNSGNFHLSIYDKEGIIQFSGNFKDKNLSFPIGLMRYFDQDGKVTKTLQFTPISTLAMAIIYHSNGKPFIIDTYSPTENLLSNQVKDQNGKQIDFNPTKYSSDSINTDSKQIASGRQRGQYVQGNDHRNDGSIYSEENLWRQK